MEGSVLKRIFGVSNTSTPLNIQNLSETLSQQVQLFYQRRDARLARENDANLSNSTTTTTTTSTNQVNNEDNNMDVSSETTRRTGIDNIQKVEGRLGPSLVYLNANSAGGVVEIRENNLEVESHANFSSIRASTCVFSGKWMYEITMCTAGIQQVGWANIQTPFTNEEGVGDSVDSYAFDGKRVKKWGGSPINYGEAWMINDIIGCCLDLDNGEVSFYRNGKSMGIAFNNVKRGAAAEGLAYFPALSLSNGERSRVNFGGKPFEYPIENFQPLQLPPDSSMIELGNYLFESFHRLLCSTDPSLSDSDTLIIANTIFPHLIPLLQDPYIVGTCFNSFLLQLFSAGYTDKIHRFFQLLHVCLEPEEISPVFQQIFDLLTFKVKTSSIVDVSVGGRIPFAYMQIVYLVLKIPQIFHIFVHHSSFPGWLESLYALKQPNNIDLAKLFPVVFIKDSSEANSENDKQKMEESFNQLNQAMILNEDYLLRISRLFLQDAQNTNHTTPTLAQKTQRKSAPNTTSYSRIFREWLRNIVKKNEGTVRNVPPPGLSDATVLTNLYFVLLRILSPYFEHGNVKEFPSAMFYNGSMNYSDFTRIGGLLGHLQKTVPIRSSADISVKEESTIPRTAMETEQTSSITTTTTTTTVSSLSDFNSNRNTDEIPMEVELLDDLVFLHHLNMGVRFKAAAMHLQNQQSTIHQLEETHNRIQRLQEQPSSSTAATGPDNVERLVMAKKVFLNDAIEHIRVCSWNRALLFTPWKQDEMFRCQYFLVRLLNHLSRFDPLFQYVPECYLDTLVDSFHALRRGDPAFAFTNNEDPTVLPRLTAIIDFMAIHFSDKRIVNPDVKDLLLQSLSVLLQYQDFVRVFERDDFRKKDFMRSMLTNFDSRFWIPISNILLRFWRGTGFAQSTKKQNDCSSPVYQALLKEVCWNDMELLTEFLNKVFNHLNWAITEFGVGAKEYQSAISSRFSPETQQHQRKCNVMFELSVCLIRIVELMTFEIPDAFTNNEIHITRLAELLLVVLSRTTVGSEAKNFDSLMRLEMIDKINRLSILSPIVGIIVNLDTYSNTHRTKCQLGPILVGTGGVKIEHFEYLCTFDWHKAIVDKEIPLDEKLGVLKIFVQNLVNEIELQKQTEEQSSLHRSESVDFCPICCVAEIDTRFEPCHHRSCHKCIKRHLLNSQKCFFCNAHIDSIVAEKPTAKSSVEVDEMDVQ